jgi:LmbE family N-acetylglucosaminyl deacetylase
MDGELDQADPAEVISRIVPQLRRIRPQVVVTFDPNGAYGHPDHIAISQSATAGIVAAADGTYRPESGPPHTVSKLYYMVSTRASTMAYQSVMGELVMRVDGVDRREVAWEDWAITTRIDTRDYWPQVWQAISNHRSQIPAFDELGRLTDERQAELWGTQHFYRAFSLVNGGRQLENDLFAGLRTHSQPPLGGGQ